MMLEYQEIPEPDYFASIKLANDENIIGGVSIIDGDDYGMYVYDPLIVKQISVISDGCMMHKYLLSPWMLYSSDSIFYLHGHHIVSHGALSAKMFEEYTNYINSDSYNEFYGNNFDNVPEEDLGNNQESTFKPLMGEIEEARHRLQQIYENQSPESQN